jgi:hypothetical protein
VPPLPQATVSADAVPPLLRTDVTAENTPRLLPAAIKSKASPPLPPIAVAAEVTPPLPPAAAAATSSELPPQYCRINYNTYQQPFLLTNGLLTAAEIDDEYCFSVVMPGCAVRLSQQGPAEFTRLAQKRAHVLSAPSPFGMPALTPTEFSFVREAPRGTFVGLVPGADYYAYVEEAPARREADEVFKAAQLLKLAEAQAADVLKNPPKAKPEGEYADFDQQYVEFGDLQDTWGGPPEQCSEQAPGEDGSTSAGASMAAGITGGGGITVGAAGWR